MRRKLLIALALLLLVIGALHIAAIFFSLYWLYWWLDMPMHFLGGAAVGIFSIAVMYFFPTLPSNRFLYAVAFLFAVLIGLGWEIFEYYTGLTYNALNNYLLDTAKDLIIDILGAWAAVFSIIHLRNGSNDNQS